MTLEEALAIRPTGEFFQPGGQDFTFASADGADRVVLQAHQFLNAQAAYAADGTKIPVQDVLQQAGATRSRLAIYQTGFGMQFLLPANAETGQLTSAKVLEPQDPHIEPLDRNAEASLLHAEAFTVDARLRQRLQTGWQPFRAVSPYQSPVLKDIFKEPLGGLAIQYFSSGIEPSDESLGTKTWYHGAQRQRYQCRETSELFDPTASLYIGATFNFSVAHAMPERIDKFTIHFGIVPSEHPRIEISKPSQILNIEGSYNSDGVALRDEDLVIRTSLGMGTEFPITYTKDPEEGTDREHDGKLHCDRISRCASGYYFDSLISPETLAAFKGRPVPLSHLAAYEELANFRPPKDRIDWGETIGNILKLVRHEINLDSTAMDAYMRKNAFVAFREVPVLVPR